MELLEDAARRAITFLKALDSRPVRADPQAAARLDELLTPAPRQATPDREVLAQLDEYFSPATMATAGPRFFGFVIGGSLPATVAANWLATAWDQNTGLYNVTPGTSVLEQVALTWLLDV